MNRQKQKKEERKTFVAGGQEQDEGVQNLKIRRWPRSDIPRLSRSIVVIRSLVISVFVVESGEIVEILSLCSFTPPPNLWVECSLENDKDIGLHL